MSKAVQRTTVVEQNANHNHKVKKDQQVTIAGRKTNKNTILKRKANDYRKMKDKRTTIVKRNTNDNCKLKDKWVTYNRKSRLLSQDERQANHHRKTQEKSPSQAKNKKHNRKRKGE